MTIKQDNLEKRLFHRDRQNFRTHAFFPPFGHGATKKVTAGDKGSVMKYRGVEMTEKDRESIDVVLA